MKTLFAFVFAALFISNFSYADMSLRTKRMGIGTGDFFSNNVDIPYPLGDFAGSIVQRFVYQPENDETVGLKLDFGFDCDQRSMGPLKKNALGVCELKDQTDGEVMAVFTDLSNLVDLKKLAAGHRYTLTVRTKIEPSWHCKDVWLLVKAWHPVENEN